MRVCDIRMRQRRRTAYLCNDEVLVIFLQMLRHKKQIIYFSGPILQCLAKLLELFYKLDHI